MVYFIFFMKNSLCSLFKIISSMYLCLYQVRVITVFTVFRLLIDFVCFHTFDFPFVRLFGVRYFCYYPYSECWLPQMTTGMFHLSHEAKTRFFFPRSLLYHLIFNDGCHYSSSNCLPGAYEFTPGLVGFVVFNN